MDRILRGIWVLKLAEFYELGLRGWNLYIDEIYMRDTDTARPKLF